MRCIHQNQKGFILPTALAFLIILSILGLSLLQVAIQTQTLSVRHAYTQVAHIASKAAIDYAEEQYELDNNYSGTDEQDLLVNEQYRVTIEVDVLYAEGNSAKRVQAFGRVYIPESSPNADYVRDIKASIIRNGEVIGTADPSDYDPILWLDANEPDSLYQSLTTNSQYVEALAGNSYRDVVEEGGDDSFFGLFGGELDFSTDDLEMSWDGFLLGHQTIGLRFRGVNAPQGTQVSEAYLQFTADETKQAGGLQLEVHGIAQDNPSSWSGDYDVSNRSKTTASVTWTPPNWNVVGASGANERVDVTPIVQELVNRSGWNPGQAMAFSISYVTGSGIRTAEAGGGNSPAPTLYVAWDPGGGGTSLAQADGDPVRHWNDKSLSGNNAVFTYGTEPVLKLNQINGLNAVRFSEDGALRAALSSNVHSNAATVFMVMAPRNSAQSNARFVSMMNMSSSSDEGTSNGVVPLFQSSTGTTIAQRYNNSSGRSISGAIDGSWAMYSSVIAGNTGERLVKNATPDNYGNSINSVNYTVNEIFIGGTRSGSNGTRYADMDVAEIIVYDDSLSCSQVQDIENYFMLRYGINVGQKDC